VRLLDPCGGTGEALRQFADVVGGETYGIEIARDRADDAQAALDRVICTSTASPASTSAATSAPPACWPATCCRRCRA